MQKNVGMNFWGRVFVISHRARRGRGGKPLSRTEDTEDAEDAEAFHYLAQSTRRTRRHSIISHRGRRGRGGKPQRHSMPGVSTPVAWNPRALTLDFTSHFRLHASYFIVVCQQMNATSCVTYLAQRTQRCAEVIVTFYFRLYFTLPTSCFLLHLPYERTRLPRWLV